MVKLEIEEYCNECPDFRAESKTKCLWKDGIPYNVETMVTCENRLKCRCLHRHILRSEEKNSVPTCKYSVTDDPLLHD